MIEMCESCRDEPGHDEGKDPAPLTNLNRAAVGLVRRSTFARCREMAGSVAGHDAEIGCSPLTLAPMGSSPLMTRWQCPCQRNRPTERLRRAARCHRSSLDLRGLHVLHSSSVLKK